MLLGVSGSEISGLIRKREPSSSERSVSIEASNSEDERSDVRHVHTASEVTFFFLYVLFIIIDKKKVIEDFEIVIIFIFYANNWTPILCNFFIISYLALKLQLILMLYHNKIFLLYPRSKVLYFYLAKNTVKKKSKLFFLLYISICKIFYS